jgi:type IV pilus assembly protein PilQ
MAALIFCTIIGFCRVSAQTIDDSVMVSLNFDDTPINVVLKMLATQNSLNLVVPSQVDGEISISLENVILRDALDAILLSSGYNYCLNNDIIVVKSSERWLVGEIVSKTYNLSHIEAAAAEAAVRPLLSKHGSVLSVGLPGDQRSRDDIEQSTQLVVIDYPSIHDIIAGLLEQIDRKRRQVSIEVKIIETNLNSDEKLGINWPQSISTSIGGVDPPGSSTDGETGSEAAILPMENGSWQLGYLNIHQLDIVLDYLSRRNNSKLLSNPRLTTLEGKTATIEVQTIIPIQTINRFSEGAVIQDIVTFQDEEVGISLKVTPRISDDSTVIMQVNPVVEEIIGYSGPADNQKPITSERSINTCVTVKNNETVVLGGLLKETTIENEQKILFLSYIPVIGGLFTHTSTEKKTTDLLILITPRILD